MIFILTRSNSKKCPLWLTTSKTEIGLVQLHYWKAKETLIFKFKTVSGLHIATFTWASIRKPSTSTTNYWERLTIKTTIFTRPAVITLSASTTMREDKLQKVHKLPFRQDYSSILPIKKMTRNLSCSTIKNSMKAQRTSWLWLQFIIWEAIMNKPHKFIKNYF